MQFLQMELLASQGGVYASQGSSGVGTVIASIVVLIVVLVLAFFSIKFLSVKNRVASKSSLLKVIDRVNLTQEAHLVVVRVEDSTYLLGVTSTQVTKLGEIDSDYANSVLEQEKVESFSKILKDTLSATLARREGKK